MGNEDKMKLSKLRELVFFVPYFDTCIYVSFSLLKECYFPFDVMAAVENAPFMKMASFLC